LVKILSTCRLHSSMVSLDTPNTFGSSTDVVFLGMPRALLQVVENGQFTFDQLWDLGIDPQCKVISTDLRCVIYIILYKAMRKANGQDGHYIGKSIRIGPRQEDHARKLADENAPGHMYSYGRTAQDKRMLIITDLSSVPLNERDGVLHIAEQDAVCLFNAFTPTLLKKDDDDDHDGLAKWYFDKVATKLFYDLSKRVFSNTGWQSLASRGLNWKSPMMESPMGCTSWTCKVVQLDSWVGEVRNSVRVYRRDPLQVLAMGFKGRRCIQLFTGGVDRRGKVLLPVPSDFPVGAMVTPVVEIYQGKNQRHPVPWPRFPEPGPFSDSANGNRVGE
jgi:hypothetical protein